MAATAANPAVTSEIKKRSVEAENHATRESADTLDLFSQADKALLPPGCSVVWTRGHTELGIGAACYARDPKVDRRYVAAHARTSFIDARRQGFRLVTQHVDVRQAGAVGDGKSDDTAACQEALDVVESDGGGVVLLPPGDYRITSPLKLPPRVGLQGSGPASLLRIHGCDGIAVGHSDIIGPRRLADFSMQGEAAEHASAIICDLDEDQRAQGLVFEYIYISFFGTAVSGRGFWHTTFRTISIHQVWRAFYLHDRNVKLLIDDCRITHGGLLKGEGYSIGVQVGDGASKFRPEDVQIDKSIIYGFDKAVVWRTALFGGVRSCDLDACTKTGLELVTADGGFTFRDNWVQVDGDAIRGVDCTALGYDSQPTNVMIVNNRINATEALGDSFGIALGNRQSDIVIDSNSVGGDFHNGVHAEGVRGLRLINNTITGSISAVRCSNVTVAQNDVRTGMTLHENVGLHVGSCFGPHSGRIVGAIVIPEGKLSQTSTFRSLGLPDLPEGSYAISLTLGDSSDHPRGDLRGRATRTGITVSAERASLEAGRIAFHAEIY